MEQKHESTAARVEDALATVARHVNPDGFGAPDFGPALERSVAFWITEPGVEGDVRPAGNLDALNPLRGAPIGGELPLGELRVASSLDLSLVSPLAGRLAVILASDEAPDRSLLSRAVEEGESVKRRIVATEDWPDCGLLVVAITGEAGQAEADYEFAFTRRSRRSP